MKANDRARLTTALRDHVAKIAADLRAKMRAPGAARAAAEQLHKDERVAEDFEVWTDLLSRRAAVLWVLKSVYVRVLEDRRLLSPGRLLDPEAQQLFEKLAPNLGETSFLRWIYKDLASSRGGVPELFSRQPAEVALPSDELSRALIAFWRHHDADTGAVWNFAEEKFEGELMGDLYQELDPVVKDRFALCQTPDFVRAFILDRTLTPAMETFGADEVRLLDPACGSGHFLIDGLKRIVAATADKHSDWSKEKVVAHAMDRVVGIDLNDYACALARTRLIMTAAELAGVTKLADAARFHPHVYWADGLEQVEKEEQKAMLQTDLFTKVEERPRSAFTRSDVRFALRKVFERRFHAVVANPPYIVESDDARKEYHREKNGRRRRYLSAYKQYSLAAPFFERCLQLACEQGFVGVITANNFMKREFGKPLVEEVLARTDLTLVVDTSRAHIPFHGTPTVLLFCRNTRANAATVRVVMGKRGDSGVPADPAKGNVWLSIVEGWTSPGFDNEYVTVSDLPRDSIGTHPWSMGGGGTTDVMSTIENASTEVLGSLVADMGRTMHTGLDASFYVPPYLAARWRGSALPLVRGEDVRDWAHSTSECVLSPYNDDLEAKLSVLAPGAFQFLWRTKTLLSRRVDFGKTLQERGMQWFEWSMFFRDRLRSQMAISFSVVATHAHFALVRDRAVFNSKAPLIILKPDASEEDYLATIALLSSSTACFWMKQVFQPKGATSANRNHPDPERFAHEFAATGLAKLPLPDVTAYRRDLVALARTLDDLAVRRLSLLGAAAWMASLASADSLREALSSRWAEHDVVRQRMVFEQEELDWLVYRAYGLVDSWLHASLRDSNERRLARGHRAFERLHGHRSFVRERGELVSPELAECDASPALVQESTADVAALREQAIQSNASLAIIEAYMYKRLWRDTEDNVREAEFRRRHDREQLRDWLLNRIEQVAAGRTEVFTVARLVAELMDEQATLVVAEVYSGTRDFSLERIVLDFLAEASVPSHPSHTYTASGLTKRAAWEDAWTKEWRSEAGAAVGEIPPPPEYSQGSRGKATDFLRTEFWRLRGKLDVPKERFVAFTEVPGRSGVETLYGWAGWTAQQRVKAILAIDEELEDASVPLADRIGLLDSAWRLLSDVAREDAAAATRLKAELQALVGPEGPSRELLEEWKKRFPPPTARAAKGRKAAVARKVDESEEDDE
ncbi:BREX-2 system adenine-specific DNA-methyltransferase PglX [Corallococcus exiguus]|uniref:BREX-2 system adenine-specific DNA-methyltransferase PglX n=1 Tax=Corallococcus exiguus TaxID=83462 RepID=UPI001560CECC|nr:BREX-2 system adenine-specific DNA-methyltransferase PglX [Corallococcus exiguus]NRD51506.1 BREX-2 system adenine-specific DNA-methyltransferase PglX [Corallococcus exiguus]